MKYFLKEQVNNSIYVAGQSPRWEVLAQQTGVIALQEGKDDELIAGLNGFATRHVGGVLAISEAEYTQKKTQMPFAASSPSSKEYLRLAQEPKQEKPRFAPSLTSAAVAVDNTSRAPRATPQEMMAEAMRPPTIPDPPRTPDIVQAPALNEPAIPKPPVRRLTRVKTPTPARESVA